MAHIAKWQILDRAIAVRKRLLRAGFLPIPCIGKKIDVPGWPNIVATEADIDGWFARYPEALNTGLLTRNTPAIDLDVYDPDVAEELETTLFEMIGEDGRTMVRFGRPPKRAVLFRTDQPFKKIRTPVFTSPDQKENFVEVLCDGQQIIVHGVHPETGKNYSWHGGEPGDVMRADLPLLTEDMARAFVERAAAVMDAAGWSWKADSKPKHNGHAAAAAAVTGNEFNAIYGDREQKYALAALAGRAHDLEIMPPNSGRNDALNKTAFRLGTMVARGWIGRDEIENRLFAAAAVCGLVADDGERAVRATIKSGLDSGAEQPHPDLEDRKPAGNETAQQNSATRPQPQKADLEIIGADQVAQQPVVWIWPRRLARAKITLIGGDPDTGKSMITIDMIARITSGAPWPDGGSAPHGSCMILSAEDAASDTICPRLDLAGANLAKVVIIKSAHEQNGATRGFSLQRDLDALREEAAKIGDVVMAVIDPITAYMGDKIDSHRTTDVRSVMERLDKFAEDSGVAIVGITHPPKATQSKAINSFTGSLAFVAAPRLAFVTVEEPETGRSLLLAVKNNLGPKADGIGYRMAPGTTAKGIESCRITWDLAPVSVTASEALAEAAGGPQQGRLREAEDFLRGYLDARPMAVDDVKAAATANGISEITLRRAREKLGVVTEKCDFLAGWQWRLP
jgi:putative DNA primase/helicase